MLVSGVANAELSSIPTENTWVTDGTVRAIVSAHGITYIGGAFTRVSPNTGFGVPIDATTGSPTLTFPRVSGSILASVPDGAGGFYIGGDFTRVGGVTRNRLAHILPDGTVGPWNPNANVAVHALAVSGTTVFVGGEFTRIGEVTRNRLAAFDIATGALTAWNPNAGGTVRALAVSGNTVYVGGVFTGIGGQTRNRLASFRIDTGELTTWNPNAGGIVHALAVSGTTVFVGGEFTRIGGG